MCAYEIKDGVAIIPEGTTKIDNEAFWYCGELVSVIIPDGVTEIGEYAFCGCSNLVKITIPMGITTIGKRSFTGMQHCNVKKVRKYCRRRIKILT